MRSDNLPALGRIRRTAFLLTPLQVVTDRIVKNTTAFTFTTTTTTTIGTMSEDPSTAMDSVTSPRRSGRSRVSTTMQIDGHTVLRKNNYKVNGITYVFDVHEEDAPKPPRKKPKTTASANAGNKKVHEETPIQARRKQHNQFVEDATNRKSKLRRAFLADQAELLLPFVEDKVLEKLLAFRDYQQRQRSSTVAEKKPVTQPKMIQKAILRPYQLKGLEFMVKMHENNLAMILGDEMGLVRKTLLCLCRRWKLLLMCSP